MSYRDELTRAMSWLGQQNDTIFLGQSVKYPGNNIYTTLKGVPETKKKEIGVMEDCQLGISIGLAIGGFCPVSIYPRMDFLICAMNQLVNHLDKLEEFTHGEYKVKVIIRTCVGSTIPLNPGIQHCSDYTEALQVLLKNIAVVKLTELSQVFPAYIDAYNSKKSSILIEMGELY